jgi:hypothetical protein
MEGRTTIRGEAAAGTERASATRFPSGCIREHLTSVHETRHSATRALAAGVPHASAPFVNHIGSPCGDRSTPVTSGGRL